MRLFFILFFASFMSNYLDKFKWSFPYLYVLTKKNILPNFITLKNSMKKYRSKCCFLESVMKCRWSISLSVDIPEFVVFITVSLRFADNKASTESRVLSGYVEVITSKVLR